MEMDRSHDPKPRKVLVPVLDPNISSTWHFKRRRLGQRGQRLLCLCALGARRGLRGLPLGIEPRSALPLSEAKSWVSETGTLDVLGSSYL